MSARRIDERVIAEHDALRAKATPGTWHVSPIGTRGMGRLSTVAGVWVGDFCRESDADLFLTLANDDEAMCRRVEELEAALRDASSKLLKQSLRANAYEEALRDIAGRQNGPGRALVLLARAALDGERP